MTTTPATAHRPTFRKVSADTYEVSIGGTVAGTVVKLAAEWWQGRYNDGTAALSDRCRIGAAWKLINS